MPKYAPDLMDYLASVGENEPTKVLADPELLARALSQEAPIALVGKVAGALEDVESHPAVLVLSTYERGRIMSALGRKEDAARLYREALASCEDPNVRGCILVNLASDVDNPEEKGRLLLQAVQEGYDEALVALGVFLFSKGHASEALRFLLQSVKKGIGSGIPLIGRIYCDTLCGEKLETAVQELLVLARKIGIEDPVDAPFDEMDARTIAVSGTTGLPSNVLAIGREIRKQN